MTNTTPGTPLETGTWTLTIPGYRDDKTTCTVHSFYTGGGLVTLHTGEPGPGPALLKAEMVFPIDIENKMYFYGQEKSPRVPLLSIQRNNIVLSFHSKRDQGYITFEDFNLQEGTLKAKGNFSFSNPEDPEQRVYQASFEIDARGLRDNSGN